MKLRNIFLLILASLGATAEAQENSSVSLDPVIFGAVRAKYEQSTNANWLHRFNVRNSRLGVKGYASEHMKYAIQIDFNNEGKISILDSYVAYTAGNFEFSVGQAQYHFNSDLDRGPSSSLFSNRSFLSKYLTTYFSDNGVKTIGSRDIGVVATYKLPLDTPIAITAGLMNGSGANNPEWSNNINFTSRIVVGDALGFQAAASYYTGKTPFGQPIEMYGGELRYAGEDYLVEAAYAERDITDRGHHTITAAHIHGYKKYYIQKKCAVNHIAPHLRYDFGRGIEFINQQNSHLERYDADRITVALNIGFAEKWIGSEIRLSYEEYIVGSNHSDAAINPLLQDKYTIEFITSF